MGCHTDKAAIDFLSGLRFSKGKPGRNLKETGSKENRKGE
jgi:hypothetical protein